MIHAPLARHLTRFSRVPDSEIARLPSAVVAMPPASRPVVVSEAETPAAAPDVETRIALACAELRDDLAAEHAAALDAQARRHEGVLATALSDAEVRFAQERGQASALELGGAVSGLEERLAEQIAKALRPLVEASLASRATAALVDTIAQALADPDCPALVVRGPAARIAAIEAALGGRPGIGLEIAEQDDLVVTGASIRIEARLAAALASLGEEA